MSRYHSESSISVVQAFVLFAASGFAADGPANAGNRHMAAAPTSDIQIIGTTPSIGHIGEPITFQGSASLNIVNALFTASDGSTIRVPGQNVASTVPHGAVSGPVQLELNGVDGGATVVTAPYQLKILPRLRLHASRQIVSSGESIRVVAAAPDLPGSWQLNWRADLGSVDSNGMFQAPQVNQTSYARIWACLIVPTECATTVVEVRPFRLETDPLILNPGETTQLKAWQGAEEVSATWQAVTANITVTPDGKLTAGDGPFDGGSAVVAATSAGITQNLSLSIRGPGAVADTGEYYDVIGSAFVTLGDFTDEVAVKGNWLYALSRNVATGNYTGPYLDTWLDVYQLDDRRNPVWVDSVEAPYISAIDQSMFYLEGNSLYAIGQEGPPGFSHYVWLGFDIRGGRPVVKERQIFDGNPAAYRHQGIGYALVSNQDGQGPITLQIVDYARGSKRTLPVDYAPVTSSYQVTGTAGTASWVAISLYYFDLEGAAAETVVFDITGPKAEPFAILPSGGFDYSITLLQDVLVVGGDVYQISGKNVKRVSQLPTHFVLDSDPATKRLLMEPDFTLQEDGYRVVDLSDAAHPKMSAPIVNSGQSTSGRLGPDYFVLLDGDMNVAIYPIEWSPGVRMLDTFPATPWMNDARARTGYLYWTGPGWGFQGRTESMGIFEIDDISSFPSHVVATMDRPGDEIGWAIELNGKYAYVGTDSELIVYDISSPTSPVQGTVVSAPAISLALLGNYLYAGSNSGKTQSLLVYDVSKSSSPRLVGSITLPDYAYALTVQPGWLAVAMGKNGLAIYSLANPSTPVLVTQLSGIFWGVAANGNLLYAAADVFGLLIYDLSNLQSPAQLSQTSLSPALAVSFDSRGIAWVCTSRDGRVYGLDVRQPAVPRHIAEITTGVGDFADANSLVWNGLLFVAGNDAAFDINTPQNVGLYGHSQSGEALPYRSNDERSNAIPTPATEPLKSRYLHGRESIDGGLKTGQRPRRSFRASRADRVTP